MESYKAFVLGLPGSAVLASADRYKLQLCMETYRGAGLPVWEASKVYKELTGRLTVVTVQQFLELVRDAFRTIWGYLEGEPVNEPHRAQDLCMCMSCIMDALEATPQAVDSLQWVDRPAIETPMGLQAVHESSPCSSIQYPGPFISLQEGIPSPT